MMSGRNVWKVCGGTNPAALDILFIHGLTGDPEATGLLPVRPKNTGQSGFASSFQMSRSIPSDIQLVFWKNGRNKK
jgi:hypothetical protein